MFTGDEFSLNSGFTKIGCTPEKPLPRFNLGGRRKNVSKLRYTRPPQSQSGAHFCHLNHHCVVFFKVLDKYG